MATIYPENLIAIGDVHGMAHTLELLVCNLEARFHPSNSIFVFLGDLIDRGPDSRSAVDLVLRVLARYPDSVFVMGNHDEYLLNMSLLSLAADEVRTWSLLGGLETLRSYGFEGDGDLLDTGKEFNGAFPEHASLFKNAVTHFETERHFFAHAGVDPTTQLANQDARDLRWIRRKFLTFTGHLEKRIVHGHSITPTELPEVHLNRIAIDTGSYRTGRIAAATFTHDTLTGFTVAESHSTGSGVRHFDADVKEVMLPTQTDHSFACDSC